nr:hypothetical protein [Tanacetum cinerariifolium]
MVVSVIEKTIQDAERIVQSIGLLHLYQTLDVRDLPYKRLLSFLRLLDPWSGPAEGSSCLSASPSYRLFSVTVSSLELNGYLDCLIHSLIHISVYNLENGRDCSSKLIRLHEFRK